MTEYYLALQTGQLNDVVYNLLQEDRDEFFDSYQNILMLPSYHDLNDENSYHMMMLGMKRKHRLLLNLSISKKIKKILKKHWINYQMKLFNKSKIENMTII